MPEPKRDAAALRRAAVLVPLCSVAGEAAVLFTLRSDRLTAHRGEVCFPGGMAEAGDDDAVACALRETHEELGIATDSLRVLGLSRPVPDRTGTILVTPVVAYLGAIDARSLPRNPDEVADVFGIPLRTLMDPAFRTTVKTSRCLAHRRGPPHAAPVADTRISGMLPAFDGGPHRVWGLTAYVLDAVLRDAIVPTLQA